MTLTILSSLVLSLINKKYKSVHKLLNESKLDEATNIIPTMPKYVKSEYDGEVDTLPRILQTPVNTINMKDISEEQDVVEEGNI